MAGIPDKGPCACTMPAAPLPLLVDGVPFNFELLEAPQEKVGMVLDTLPVSQTRIGQAIKQRFERNTAFRARKLSADAEVDPEAEGHMVARVGPKNIKSIRVAKPPLVAVCRGVEQLEMSALGKSNASYLHFSGGSAKQPLDRRVKPQRLLDRIRDPGAVIEHSLKLLRIIHQPEHRAADQVG